MKLLNNIGRAIGSTVCLVIVIKVGWKGDANIMDVFGLLMGLWLYLSSTLEGHIRE